VDVAACRTAFELAELRSTADGWGLSPAGVAAVCAAQPPLSRDGLLALGGERPRLEAPLGLYHFILLSLYHFIRLSL
jgi:hypothetical protein